MPPSRKQAVLLVDGYNVIGAWTDLHESLRQTNGQRHTNTNPLSSGSRADLEAARNKLVEALINFSAFEDYQTKIVFDAYSRDVPAYCEIVTPNLSIHYSDFLETADTYIEKFCAAFRHDLQYSASRLIVATSDRAQQLTAIGFGAEWMSSLQLISDVDFSAKSRNDGIAPKSNPPDGFSSIPSILKLKRGSLHSATAYPSMIPDQISPS